MFLIAFLLFELGLEGGKDGAGEICVFFFCLSNVQEIDLGMES